jgi:hypothetical protein
MDLVNKTLAYTITGPGITPTGDSSSQLEKIISGVIGVLTIVAFIFFAFQIIFAGYSFLSSQGDAAKLKAARDRLTNGILGIVIVVIAFGITAFLSNLLGIENVFSLSTFINSIKP